MRAPLYRYNDSIDAFQGVIAPPMPYSQGSYSFLTFKHIHFNQQSILYRIITLRHTPPPLCLRLGATMSYSIAVCINRIGRYGESPIAIRKAHRAYNQYIFQQLKPFLACAEAVFLFYINK